MAPVRQGGYAGAEVSLHPLEPEQALAGLLQVKPKVEAPTPEVTEVATEDWKCPNCDMPLGRQDRTWAMVLAAELHCDEWGLQTNWHSLACGHEVSLVVNNSNVFPPTFTLESH